MMRTTSFKKIMLVFFIGISLVSCGYSDPFYGKGSGWDYLRFPLIKPYYVMSLTNGEPEWVIPLEREIPLKEVSSIMEIGDVQKIFVVDTVIMVYTPDSTAHRFGDYDFIFHWFILNPDEHVEIGFETENDFMDYLHQNELDEPEWLDPLEILQRYDQTGCLDWIPDCQ